MNQGRDGRRRAGARHAAAAAQSGARRQVGDGHRRKVRHHRAGRARGCSSRRSTASAATIRCRSRSSARCSPSTSCSDWREGCERCKQILRYGGMGHTMSIHSQNDQVILEFGLKKPAFRIVVNYADDARVDRADDRAGSGDDARVRRLRRQHHVGQHLAAAPAEHQAAGVRDHARRPTGSSARTATGAVSGQGDGVVPPIAAAVPAAPPPSARPRHQRRASFARRSTQFLAARARLPADPSAADRRTNDPVRQSTTSRRPAANAPAPVPTAPLDFVCEEDVRLAMQSGPQARAFRARHRDAGGARPRRTAPRVHDCAVARITAEC